MLMNRNPVREPNRTGPAAAPVRDRTGRAPGGSERDRRLNRAAQSADVCLAYSRYHAHEPEPSLVPGPSSPPDLPNLVWYIAHSLSTEGLCTRLLMDTLASVEIHAGWDPGCVNCLMVLNHPSTFPSWGL